MLNHAEAVSLKKDPKTGTVVGARIRNNLTGKEFDVYAKVVVNATGSSLPHLLFMQLEGAVRVLC